MKRLLCLITALSLSPVWAHAAGNVDQNYALMSRLILACNSTAMQTALTSYPFVDPNDENTAAAIAQKDPFLAIAITSSCNDDTKLKMMKVLLDAGENPNHPARMRGSNSFLSLVVIAFDERQADGVLMLIQAGADPNQPIGSTKHRGLLFRLAATPTEPLPALPYQPAALHTDDLSTGMVIDVMKVLVAHGAHVNQTSEGGYTPLLVGAFGHGDWTVLQNLISLGADVHATTIDGWNARELSQVQYNYYNDKMCRPKTYPPLDDFFTKQGLGLKQLPARFGCFYGDF